MVDFLAALIGHVRGGLQYVLLGAMYLVSGISGSKAADMAAVAPALFPEMKKRGAARRRPRRAALGLGRDERDDPAEPRADHDRLGHRRLDRGAVHRRPAAGAVVGIARARGRGGAVARRDLAHVRKRERGADRARRCWIALPALALPFVIRTAVVEGVATATEVSTVGIVYTILAGLFVYRQFDWRRLYADAGRDRVAVRRDPAHHRLRDRDGLGADAVGLLAGAGRR